MMAAATVAAGTFLQILLGRNAAQFKGLADDLLHALLQLVHFLLGVYEPFAHRIAQKGVTLGIKRRDFLAIEGKALMLPFMERAALFAQALILLLRFAISRESINALADALELRLLDDGLAQFQSFLANRVLNQCISGLHKLI